MTTMTKGRMIVSHKEYMKAINTSIAAAKDSKHSKWVVNHRNGEVYANDPVCFLKTVGDKTGEILRDAGITSAMHLMEFPTAALTEQLGTTMTAHRINKIKRHNKDTYKSTNKPEDLVTDHTEADNPYASLYGDNEWEDEIRRTGAV